MAGMLGNETALQDYSRDWTIVRAGALWLCAGWQLHAPLPPLPKIPDNQTLYTHLHLLTYNNSPSIASAL